MVFSSQQLANEDHWKELTQYFGINDRFESPVDSRAPQKVIVVTKAMTSFFDRKKKKAVLTEVTVKLSLFGCKHVTESF